MAELVDALDSGSSECKLVWVQVPFPADIYFGVHMKRYIVVSVASGVLFGVMDALINANPAAMNLFSVYSPIARAEPNYNAGIVIDLVYGFIMAYIFILLYKALPSKNSVVKGVYYGLIMWFFRVVMYGISQWMIIEMDAIVLIYILLSGLAEILLIGILYGLTLKGKTA